MIFKKITPPSEGQDFQTYKKFVQTRGKTKYPSIRLNSEFIEDSYEREVIRKVCIGIVKAIIKGHDIPIPYLGCLTYQHNLVAQVNADGTDYRSIDFEKQIIHEYNQSEFDENPKYSGNTILKFYLKRKSKNKTKSYLFYPHCFMYRLVMNEQFGKEYKIPSHYEKHFK